MNLKGNKKKKGHESHSIDMFKSNKQIFRQLIIVTRVKVKESKKKKKGS